jgi:chaperonin GroEL
MKRPSVVFQPHTSSALLRGMNLMADAVRPTLGPRPRHVAYEKMIRTQAPELLSDAATLVRRIIEISDGPSDLGAMLLRQAVWKVGDGLGDGGATTAVLAQSLAQNAHRMLAAGANAMRLRDGIQMGLKAATAALQEQVVQVQSQADLTRIAKVFCFDDEMAHLLGEIYSIIGTAGFVDVQTSHGRTIEREYVEGAFWRNSGFVSSAFADPKNLREAVLGDAVIMLVDGRINKVEPMVEAVNRILKAGHQTICCACRQMTEDVIAVMAHNHLKGNFKFVGVKTPLMTYDRKAMLDDLAVLTGGTLLASDWDADMSYFTPEMLGKARRVWAQPSQFGIIAGKGSPKALRAHIAMLRRSLANPKNTKEETAALHQRLGRLTGGMAVLMVGAATEPEQKLRQELAERSVRFMRSVAQYGLVPGGGAAYLACQPAVQGLRSDDPDVQSGIDCVTRALEAPMRAIAQNAGLGDSPVVAHSRAAGAGYGLNALTGEIVYMREAGILDSAEVTEQALLTAASMATMLFTTDVVVRHHEKKIRDSFEP